MFESMYYDNKWNYNGLFWRYIIFDSFVEINDSLSLAITFFEENNLLEYKQFVEIFTKKIDENKYIDLDLKKDYD